LASHLVVLNECGPSAVPSCFRSKTRVIVQSARPLSRAQRSRSTFNVAVIGHLRAEKDPQLVWNMLDRIPPDLALRVIHAGAALDPNLKRRAIALGRRDSRYKWIGDRPRAEARQLMRRAHVLLHPSVMEGGAQAVIESITAQTPVIGSYI